MAKFFGNIGFVETKETSPGVWTEVPTERPYYGDVVSNVVRWNQASDQLNDNITIGNSFSIVADSYVRENLGAMRYIVYCNTPWKISSVDIQYPRVSISVGGVYNGERAQD